ncbi:SppA protein [Paraburkholderia tropica]
MTTNQSAVAALAHAFPGRDFILISQGITRALYTALSDQVQTYATNPTCTVFLTTNGGDPHAAFRIARCLRSRYTHVRIVVPSHCKSAGTLIALSANEIVIGDRGELGPLDVQVSKPDELAERGSGLDIMQALEMTWAHALNAFSQTLMTLRHNYRLSTRMAGQLASEMAVKVVNPLYSQIDPSRLAEMQRATGIAIEYGKRLDQYARNLKQGALERIVLGYPSHGFVIDRKEASSLFNSVHHPHPSEVEFFMSEWPKLAEQSGFGPTYVATPAPISGENNANGPELEPGASEGQPDVPPVPSDAGTPEPAHEAGVRTDEVVHGVSEAGGAGDADILSATFKA